MEADAARAVELLVAAQTGDVARLRALLPLCGDPVENGAAAVTGGVTLLMAAAASGHEAMVELLLERGEDPARRDRRGRSAAFYARAAGHPCLAARLDTVVDVERGPVSGDARWRQH
jgi:ankyrin repeat protein